MQVSISVIRRIIRESLENSSIERELFDSFDEIFGEVANKIDCVLRPLGYHKGRNEPYLSVIIVLNPPPDVYISCHSSYSTPKGMSKAEKIWVDKMSQIFDDALNDVMSSIGFAADVDPLDPDNFKFSLDDTKFQNSLGSLETSETMSIFEKIEAALQKSKDAGYILDKSYTREISLPNMPKATHTDFVMVTPPGTTKQVNLISASNLTKLKSSNPGLADKVVRYKNLNAPEQTDVIKRVRAAFPSPELSDR